MSKYAHEKCELYAKNCKSGCCNWQGDCARSSSQCIYLYSDYETNQLYYFIGTNYRSQNFPQVINPNCSLSLSYCQSGCCDVIASCASKASDCAYRSTDFYTNPDYYFSSENNGKCNNISRTCASRCCNKFGHCANSSNSCRYLYPSSGISGQPMYQYPVQKNITTTYHNKCSSQSKLCPSGCCDNLGSCAQSISKCKYVYHDYHTNQNYYFSKLGDQEWIFIYCAIGALVALLLFIFVLLCCKWRVQETDVYEAVDSIGLGNQPPRNEQFIGQNQSYSYIQNNQNQPNTPYIQQNQIHYQNQQQIAPNAMNQTFDRFIQNSHH